MQSTIIIQGILNKISLSNLTYYKKIGNVIVSYWDTDDNSILNDYDTDDVIFIKNSYHPHFIRYFNNQNMYYQVFNTYNALKEVKTEFVIKTRSDNKFENLDLFIKSVYDNPNKYTSSNLHFRPPETLPFHASDKLIGGRTDLLLKTFEICKYRCENDQLLLMSGIYDETTYFGIDKKFKLWSADLKKPYTEINEEPIIGVEKLLINNHIGIVSEMLITTSFLMSKDIKPNIEDIINQLYHNFFIVKVEDLQYTNKNNSEPEHNWLEINDINELIKDKNLFKDHYIDWRDKRIKSIINYYGENWFKNKKILELGCGFADIGNIFSKLGSDVTVSDVRKEHLIIIKQKYPHLNVIECDLDNSWLFDEHYDLILHTGVLYHLKNYEQNLINCFKNCDNIFLETEVSDSLDINYVYYKNEDDSRYDQAFNGIGCKPSERNLENIISKNGFLFERYFKEELNSEFHIYNWENKNDNSFNEGFRRAWFCKKKNLIKEHFYENIDGWFDFQTIYTNMVNKFDSGAHFVEIGSWKGKSTSYMGVEIANSGKDIKFDCIDTWEGSKGSWDENLHIDMINNLNGISLYQHFLENVRQVKDYINPIQGFSFDIVDKYKNNSLDFVFIDGSHDYESVKKDIQDWYPKVKENGVIGGHDYNSLDWPGVVQAVNEFFTDNINIIKKDTWSWFVNKEDMKSKQKICVLSVCLNEEKILPFYLDYYTNFIGVDKIILYDGGSTDNTSIIIKEYPNVEFIIQRSEKLDDRELTRIRNEEWKKYRNDYDWFIVCDMDEFIYHPNLKDKLYEYKKLGITIPFVEGFDMISKNFPNYKKGDYLFNLVKNGIKNAEFLNKNIIFDSKIDINYRIGCHSCEPSGLVKYSDNFDFKLLHYRWLSYDYLINKSYKCSIRLSDWNLENNAGYHYNIMSKTTQIDYINRYKTSRNVFNNEVMSTEYAGLNLSFHKLLEKENNSDYIVVKIGTSDLSNKSTIIYSWFVNQFGGELYVVDDNQIKLDNTKETLINKKIELNNIKFIQSDCIEFLDTFDKKIDLLYLDDREYNGDDENLKKSELKHLESFLKAEKHLSDNSIIVDDFDTNVLKGKLIPYLLKNNYESVEKDLCIFRKPKSKKIYIFSHNYLINDWKNILENQLNEIKDSGLYENTTKLFLFAFGDDNQWKIFNDLISIYDKENKIEIKRFDDNFYEYHTLQYMWNFCQNNDESYILYFHLKGVWSSLNLQINNEDEYDSTIPIRNPEAIKKWRDCLEYFNIEKWYECVDKLNEYDTVGALYNYNPDCPIYTGNFWWSNSNHIKKLKYPIFEKEKEQYDSKLWIRIKCEKWINSIENKFFNFYVPKDFSVYYIPILEDDYKNINPLISILTPTYNRHDDLKNTINCILNQSYSNWEMLICSDGDDITVNDIIKSYNDKRLKYYFTEQTNDSGGSQRNFLTSICNGKYIVYLDDDNVIYPNHLQTVVDNFDEKTGMIVYRIDYDGLNHCLPIEDKIILGKIDTLNFVVDKYYTKNAIWNNYIEHDYEVMKICENNILNHNKKIKFIPNILGRHIDKKSKKVNLNLNEIWNHSNSNFFIQQKEYEWKNFLEYIQNNTDLNNVLEIGSYSLGSTSSFVEIFKNVISVDISKGQSWDNFKLKNDNWNYFIGDSSSSEMLEKIKNLNIKFDLIFIDGDHTYDGVKRDFIIYKEFLNDKGIISFHDILNTDFHKKHNCNVDLFWNEIKKDYNYKEFIDISDGEDSNICFKTVPRNFWGGIGVLNINNENNVKKEVVIMTAHPNFKTSEDITKSAIQSFGDRDIILSTHCPVSVELQKMVKYFLYDKNNPLIRHDYYDQSWFNTDEYYALIKLHKNDNDLQHALAVYINYYNAVMYAKSLGYTTTICTNFDIVFSTEDLNTIDSKIKEMYQTGKKSFFMTSDANEGIHYKTIFFITDVDFFLDNFKYVTNEIDYNKLTREVGSETNCLENFFYQTLKNSDKLLLQQISENDLFSNSRVNVFSNIEYFTILPLRNDDNHFVVWFSSANSIDNRHIGINVLKGSETIFSHTEDLTQNYCFYKEIEFEKGCNYEIICSVHYTDVVNQKIIVVNDEIFSKIKEYGDFWKK